MLNFPYCQNFCYNMDLLKTLKRHYDMGNTKFVESFSRCDLDMDSISDEVWDSLYNAAQFVDTDYIEDFETDKWFFASDDMTEFYRLARKIGRIKGFSKKDNPYEREAYHYGMDALANCNYGISGYLYTGTRHRYASSWIMYISQCEFCQHFELAAAVSEIFMYYSNEVMKLRDIYDSLMSPSELGVAA